MLVLDLTRLLPGPLAGRMLAEMGYRVHRVLPPRGDLLEAASPEAYAWLHQGKSSETVDLKTPAGRERLQELVGEAVALLETNRPGVMERFGLGPETLRALNPQLTYVRLAGFRDTPAQPGHDLAYLAADGLLERFEPAWQTVQLADSTGAFWAVIATIEGLRRGGGFYEVYMAETARTLAYPALPGLDGSAVCYSQYPTAAGTLVIAALEPHLWAQCCNAFDHPEWQTEAFTPTHETNSVWRAVCALLRTRTAVEWEAWALAQNLPLRAVREFSVPASLLPWHHQP